MRPPDIYVNISFVFRDFRWPCNPPYKICVIRGLIWFYKHDRSASAHSLGRTYSLMVTEDAQGSVRLCWDW